MKKQENLKQNKTNINNRIKNAVLLRIKNKKLRPTDWYIFFCINCFVWMLWSAVIFIGAIAVTESIYVSMHSGFEFYEVTHGSFANFVLDSLPYVWLILFIMMLLIAEYNLIKTKRGYKYTLWQILFSNIILTVFAGYILYGVGAGHVIDSFIGRTLPVYVSTEARQEYLWTHPQDGRISGYFTEYKGSSTDAYFQDVIGRKWVIETRELSPENINLLTSGKKIRLLGKVTTTGDIEKIFYGCFALSWDSNQNSTFFEMLNIKKDIDELMNKFYPSMNDEDLPGMKQTLRCRKIMSEVLYKNYPTE